MQGCGNQKVTFICRASDLKTTQYVRIEYIQLCVISFSFLSHNIQQALYCVSLGAVRRTEGMARPPPNIFASTKVSTQHAIGVLNHEVYTARCEQRNEHV
jgi:hypothetical protein